MNQMLINQYLVELSKLSDVLKNNVVKKDVYNAKMKNIEDKTPDITNLLGALKVGSVNSRKIAYSI